MKHVAAGNLNALSYTGPTTLADFNVWGETLNLHVASPDTQGKIMPVNSAYVTQTDSAAINETPSANGSDEQR